MPLVKFLGTTPARRVRSARVDDVVLERNGEPQQVTAKQLERLRELPGYRFEEAAEKKESK